MDNIAKKLNITDQTKWYNLSTTVIRQHGGSALLTKHKHSICKILKTVYPEYQWDSSKFATRASRDHWGNLSNQLLFIDQLAKKLNITNHEHLYRLTRRHIQEQHGGTALLHKCGSLSTLLTTLYPDYKKFCRNKVLSVVADLKLPHVADLLHVSPEYPSIH